MIEGGFFPVRLRVAGLAVLSKAALVHIVLPVAGITFLRRFTVLFSGGVTCLAFRFKMFSEQRIVRQLVIEFGFVEIDDVRRPAKVIAMAIAARLLRIAPVISEGAGNILGHILMAGHAESLLSFFLERLMTLSALGLNVGMALDDFAGHDEHLDRIRMCVGGKENDERQQQCRKARSRTVQHLVHVNGNDVDDGAEHQ